MPERYIPDPYLYAVILTFVAVAAALVWTDSRLSDVLAAWYAGLWSLLGFSMQMALVLLTGVALADAPPVKRIVARLASLPKDQTSAASMVFVIAFIGSWANWGFGLVIGAILAREVAKRLREVDFSFLVAAAYVGFIVADTGLSSSIALATATPGNPLNLVEKITGKSIGFGQTVFAPYLLVPTLLLLLLYPVVLKWTAPGATDMKRVDPTLLQRQDAEVEPVQTERTFATWLENAPVISGLLVLMAVVYAVCQISTSGFMLDFNGLICSMLVLGLLCHWRPIAYVRSFTRSAGYAGPIILQYPLYGGIMGIMTATGLAGLISKKFVAFSTPVTLPFWSFVSSNVISLFVPSGGGHWAVQGPFMVPAAVALKVDPGMVAMAVGMGEQTANMIQPFWALPLLALARLGVRDIMGYCAIALLIGLVLFGGSLLLFASFGT